jgi:hypothetical protein
MGEFRLWPARFLMYRRIPSSTAAYPGCGGQPEQRCTDHAPGRCCRRRWRRHGPRQRRQRGGAGHDARAAETGPCGDGYCLVRHGVARRGRARSRSRAPPSADGVASRTRSRSRGAAVAPSASPNDAGRPHARHPLHCWQTAAAAPAQALLLRPAPLPRSPSEVTLQKGALVWGSGIVLPRLPGSTGAFALLDLPVEPPRLPVHKAMAQPNVTPLVTGFKRSRTEVDAHAGDASIGTVTLPVSTPVPPTFTCEPATWTVPTPSAWPWH